MRGRAVGGVGAMTTLAAVLGLLTHAQEPGSPCAGAATDEARLKCLEQMQRQCGGIADQAERLMCYDRLLGTSSTPPKQAAAEAATEPAPAAHEEPNTKWKRADEPGAGLDAVVFTLDADNEIRDWRGRTARPRLVVACAGGRMDARAAIGAAVQPEAEDTRTAQLSFDGGETVAEKMMPSADEKELRFADAAAAVGQLRRHAKLTFRFTPFRAEPAAVEFDLAGLGALLEPEHAACGIAAGTVDAAMAAPPSAAETAALTLVEVAPRVTAPVAIAASNRPPVYPTLARAGRIEGVVDLALVVKADGSVGEVKVLRCTRPGFGFEAAAVTAVKRWKYRPATQDGEPVDYTITIPVRFAGR